MLKKTALIFSAILHPLFMPVAGMLILLFAGSYVSLLPLAAKKMILLLFASGTFILPALMLPLAFMRGDILMQKQNDRTFPLALAFIFYLLTYILFLKVPVYGFMHSYMLGALVSVFMALMINLRWKISIHMIGLGGLTAFLFIITFTRQINLFPWLLISIAASGIAGAARLYLDSHSPSQVYAGYLVGTLAMSMSLILFGS